MADNHELIAKMMADLGCTGEHITASGIQERILEIDYQTINLAGTKMMFCGIRLKTNEGSFVVTGEPSVCIDPANWREKIGHKVSFDNAFRKIWQLEAYRKLTTV